MIRELFNEFISMSGKLRIDYPKSLGCNSDSWKNILKTITEEIPLLFEVIYGTVSGTKRKIKRQELMDFTPGYRLIYIDEIVKESISFNDCDFEYDQNIFTQVIPLLTNYSSDYICYCKLDDGQEVIASVMHDEGILEIMHLTIERFLETLCAFYRENVYFLDGDGYLDYDLEKEGWVGARINPGVPYWLDS